MSQQRLTKQQIAQLARQAGWSEDKIPFVVGVAGAESGYNPRALNPNVSTGDESYGLMQINMLGSMGPERLKAFGLKSKEQLYDPLTNLKAAKKIYEWQGPGAWSVYKSGKYKDYMPAPGEISQTATGTQPVTAPQVQPKTTDPGVVQDFLKNQIVGQLLLNTTRPVSDISSYLYQGIIPAAKTVSDASSGLFQGLLNTFMDGSVLKSFQ